MTCGQGVRPDVHWGRKGEGVVGPAAGRSGTDLRCAAAITLVGAQPKGRATKSSRSGNEERFFASLRMTAGAGCEGRGKAAKSKH